ncbi:MAG: P-II family nitrogen regulator [Bacillota bacterium]
MELLVIVLNRVEKLGRVLGALTQAGVSGATVFESVGTGRARPTGHLPLISGLRRMVEGDKQHSDTIFCLVPDPAALTTAVAAVRAVMALGEPGEGLMFTLPVGSVFDREGL